MTPAAPAPAASGAPAAAQQPELAPGEEPAPERTFRKEPIESDLESPPAGFDGGDNSASYFEAPRLFDPKDRTAQHSAASVRHAVYHQPIAAPQTSVKQATHVYDASGWVSASQ